MLIFVVFWKPHFTPSMDLDIFIVLQGASVPFQWMLCD